MEFVIETISTIITLFEILSGRLQILLEEINEFLGEVKIIEDRSSGIFLYDEQSESELLI